MSRPPFEVADIIRTIGKSFIDRNRSWLTGLHLKVLTAIERCRTAALGGHRDRCDRCGYETTSYSYNSCRNRHCGKCQTNARNHWLAARSQELLPVSYVHVVFTLPHQLGQLVFHNQRILYDLLFRTSAATLLEVATNPQHLGAQIGFLSVLHTWGQTLQFHPHVHCVIPSGGLALDHQQWVHPRYPFFLPVDVLGLVFRGKFVAGLKRAWRARQLCLPGELQPLAQKKLFRSFIRSLYRQPWVVYAKPPFGGPQHVLHYLARYTHRVAISNHRLVNFADGKVLKTTEFPLIRPLLVSPLLVRFHPELRSFNRQSDPAVDELSEAFEIGDLGLHLGHEGIADILCMPLPPMGVAQVPVRSVSGLGLSCLLTQ